MVSVRRLVDIPLPEYSDGDQSVWPDILPPEDVLSQPSASQLPTSQPATPSGREQKPYYHVSETRLNSFLSKVSAPLREYYTQYPNRCPALKGLNDARIEISAAARIPEMPAGYVLVEQRRTNKDGTRSKHIDVYIFGHPSGSKFRSTHEFIPHLLWLAMTETRDHAECTCKLCPNYVRRQGTPASVQRSSAKSFIDLVTPPMELKPTPVKRKAMARKSGAGTPGTPSNQPLKQTIAVDNDDPITVISPKLPSEKTYSHSGDVVGSSLAEIMAKNSSTTPSNSQKTDAHSGGLPSNRVALSVPHLNALPGSSPRNTPLRAKLPSGKRRQVETLIFDSPTPSSLIRPTKRRIDVVPDSIAGPSKEKLLRYPLLIIQLLARPL
ncbi:hypothetical protein BC832DRAFT_142884 [Gaertneriomyces semiglobifer]|nr:hypothetical protein BC832DRAFT_142884 [Gaertneriomyces semiglobifer]